ncbi:MAG: VanZ family protein [Pseudorhodoplanes sp.]|nr:VanZ family protein [Pseudorhodoplanes sp.]
MKDRTLIRAARVAGWSLILAIAVLSLMPAALRPAAFGLPGLLQHLAAYFAAAFLLTLGLHDRNARLAVGGLLLAYAVALEFGQTLVPGRHPAIVDALAGGLGGAAGCAATMLGLPFRLNRS